MPTKILAIDDSKTIRYAIKITFAAEDADVTTVSKGSDAVARASQLGADVVLVDASLADGEPSGYEVCQALKSDPSTSSIPVIVMVSNQQGVDQGALKSAGGDAWIAKPFDTQELIDKVAEAAGKPAAKPTAAAAAKPTPVAKPVPAARPVAPPPAAAAPAPARAPAAAKPKPAAAAVPTLKPPTRPAPAPAPAPARAAAPAAPSTGGDIPIAIPIPFTSASAPTPGILERLQQAGGGAAGAAAAGLDPKVAEALVSLSREVIEQVVWEVVPDLAEAIIKRQARSA